MFHHSKELQFNARVSGPDPRFASLLLEQFGGANGELKACMQYFVQAFSARKPFPDKYDLLMDIATEEISHLEIVGATIQMLLNGINGELKDISESSTLMQILGKKDLKESIINESIINPQFLVLTGGGPRLTDSQGVPFQGSYINANGDLTVDLRSNIAAESRAKIVYEYLMQFTDDVNVKETLGFLMTREIAHAQMFEAALATIQPNFPPGVLQGDPRFSNTYFNMSDGNNFRGPWNEGISPDLKESWDYIENPVQYVDKTNGLTEKKTSGTSRTKESVRNLDEKLSQKRSEEIKSAVRNKEMQWSEYNDIY
ncbi:MAG: manganese catalase family protein [Bacteroidales bacterium]|nr:manganese catalase family protein [Bacteroidales bacterium]